jgi:hypothetical protein
MAAAHLAHAPPAIHPGMHVREAAAIRCGVKDLGFAPRGEAGRLITNGMSRSAMRFPLAARDVVWNRCDLAVRHEIGEGRHSTQLSRCPVPLARSVKGQEEPFKMRSRMTA